MRRNRDKEKKHKRKQILSTGKLTQALGSLGLAAIIGISGQLNPNLADAAVLNGWTFNPTTNQLEIRVQEDTTPEYFFLQEPPRIVVDLPNTELGNVKPQQDYSGLVRQVRVGQFSEGVTRIVLEIAPQVVLSSPQIELQKLESKTGENRWRIRPLISQTVTSPSRTTMPPVSSSSVSNQVTVTVPPLNSRVSPSSNETSQIEPTSSSPPWQGKYPIIEFGQPLPKSPD
ncbi:MAG: AMIN domain-containing protein [Chroococcales cyanobacterium]